ncbi:ParB N-terminal domain-containing protein [Paenibacillus macerans]|uniref:ParB N-terminal domain-containing protein n=1 Tax=Paenibacillus macerans TaxID=44252 RepID=UPI001F0EB28E|nr:ParB N-terminal domain-containing protein [Paenibacillus macerans]MBS5912822.1 ParB N-terminal domain-containing protein [Paenibacillus macerans]MEC0141016.1 ParB N-terminal domain-containing protein [Paenibacillus macerans]UMV45361.1 ParB N-terminal domain-containing protein [Paenibacillus macerans]
MASKRPVPKLASIDELLLLSEQPSEPSDPSVHSGGIQSIPINKIRFYQNHPFRLYEDERLTDMADSIQANGVLVPVIIRKIEPDENGCEYEMLAGHNRMNAAGMVGLDHLPCIVKDHLSDEEALMYVVETNVLQRSFSEMLPSEKAKVLSLRYSDMFSQGKRNDIIEELQKLENPQYIKENPTSPLVGAKLRTDEKLGIEYGLSKNTVARLLRIDHLIIELKRRVDDAEIGIYPAVDLSYLSEAEQRLVDGILSEQGYKVDMKKSTLLREYAGKLTDEQVVRILSGEATRKPRSKTPAPFKLKHKVYAKYFSPLSKASEVEEIIDKALEMYFSHQRQQPNQETKEDDHDYEV